MIARRSSFAKFHRAILAAAGIAAAALSGCSGPNRANIELRKENQQLSAKIDQLNRRHAADQADIRVLDETTRAVEHLTEARLDQLYTTAGLRLGKLSGGFHPDPNRVGDTMLKIYVVPIDQDGDPIKAAGSFRVELFDLALPTDNRIGQWDFDLQAARADWYAQLFMYEYVLNCPFQNPPDHSSVLMRVTFTDALTGRVFTVDRDITVQLPPEQ